MTRTFCIGVGLMFAIFGWQHVLHQQAQAGSIVSRCEPRDSLQPQRALQAHAQEVRGLAYSRDGRLLVSAGEDGRVKLWTARALHCLRTLRVSSPCVAFSPDGRQLATANFDPDLPPSAYNRPVAWRVEIWDVRSGRLLRGLSGHKAPVEWVAWSPNGKLLASASYDGSVRIWHTRTWRAAATLREPFSYREKGDHVGAAQAVFSPDGKRLAMVSVDEYQGMPGSITTHVSLWDTVAWKRRRLLLKEQHCGNAIVAFTSDSRRLAAATQNFPSDGSVYTWDLPNGSKKAVAEDEDASYAATLVPPGHWFVAGGKEWVAYLLDLRTGEIAAHLPHPSTVTAMAASPDGKTVVTGDSRGTIRFWSVPPGSARAGGRTAPNPALRGRR